MSKRAEEAALKAYPSDIYSGGKSCRRAYKDGYEQAEKDTIQRIKELLKVRIVERTERCQEDWSNRQKDRVNIRNDEDRDIILVLEKLGEE
jgi:hypothetical protein